MNFWISKQWNDGVSPEAILTVEIESDSFLEKMIGLGKMGKVIVWGNGKNGKND